MAKPFVPWSKEKNDRYNAERERQRQETDRCILAAIEAINQGKTREEVKAAIDAACDTPPKPKAADAPDFSVLLEPHRMRADGWTADMQRTFIRTLADTGSVTHAAKAAGVSRSTAYALRHRAGHATFAVAWDVAIQLGRKRLLDIAMERAAEGQEVPVWYRGEQVGTRTVFNDRLLTFLIGHTPAPAHSQFSAEELAAMFGGMIDAIETTMPHPLALRLAAEQAAAEAKAAEENQF